MSNMFLPDTVEIEDFIECLTPRELECLCIRCDEGVGFREIGDKLGIGEFTVRNYMQEIYRKIGTRNPIILCQIYRLAQKRTEYRTRARVKGVRFGGLELPKHRSVVVE